MSADVLNVQKAAVLLGRHPNTIRKLAKARQIPATKIGQGWSFTHDDLVGWIRAGYFVTA